MRPSRPGTRCRRGSGSTRCSARPAPEWHKPDRTRTKGGAMPPFVSDHVVDAGGSERAAAEEPAAEWVAAEQSALPLRPPVRALLARIAERKRLLTLVTPIRHAPRVRRLRFRLDAPAHVGLLLGPRDLGLGPRSVRRGRLGSTPARITLGESQL